MYSSVSWETLHTGHFLEISSPCWHFSLHITVTCLPAEEESEESSSGEVEIEQEVPSDPEDPRELHPGALLHRSSRLHNLPLMAEALAHGADVHAASEEEEGKTPLIQAVMGVRDCWAVHWTDHYTHLKQPGLKIRVFKDKYRHSNTHLQQ